LQQGTGLRNALEGGDYHALGSGIVNPHLNSATRSAEEILMEKGKYWDIGGLASALAGSDEALRGTMSVSFIPGTEGTGVIQVTLHSCGDLGIVVGVAELEIQASVVLDPVSEVPNNAAFEHNLLRANKLLPLSTFGITEINGTEHYEIFGQLSGGSEIEEIIEEIETLGRNAIEAAEMIETWKSQNRKQAA
jgi:uncharacterized protein